MSIAPSPNRTEELPTGEVQQNQANRLDQFIDSRIMESCRALWRAELIRKTLGLIVTVNCFALLWLIFDQWVYSPGPATRFVALLLFITFSAAYAWRYMLPVLGSSIEPEYAARSIERDLPDSRQSLLSYLTLREGSDKNGLRGGVVRSLGSASGKQLQHHDALPSEATGTVGWWMIAIFSIAILAAYVLLSPKSSVQAMMRLGAPFADIDAPKRVSIVDVLPGNTEVTAGRSIPISARITGLNTNEPVMCYWRWTQKEEEIALSLQSDTQRHQGQLSVPISAKGVLYYRLVAGDSTAGPFELTVQDIPVVTIESVNYQPPAYTKLGSFPKSGGAIRAIDGTKIQIKATVNRPVKRARIEFNPERVGKGIQATAGTTELTIDSSGAQLSASFTLRSGSGVASNPEKDSYRIVVWDMIDQQNIDPIIYPIEIIPDLPPEISITVPSQTPKDLPLNAQQTVEIHASDPDFGLSRIAIEIRYGNNQTLTPILWENPDGALGHQVASIPIRPEELRLSIGDRVRIIGIATDNRNDPDSDLVRPNIVRTDPIQLTITAPGELPDPEDPTSDGISAPDSKQESQASDQDQTGAEDSGGSGSGGSGNSDTRSSQEGDGQNGETSSSSESSNNNEKNQEGSESSADGGSSENEGSNDQNSSSSDNSRTDGQNSGSESSTSDSQMNDPTDPSNSDPNEPTQSDNNTTKPEGTSNGSDTQEQTTPSDNRNQNEGNLTDSNSAQNPSSNGQPRSNNANDDQTSAQNNQESGNGGENQNSTMTDQSDNSPGNDSVGTEAEPETGNTNRDKPTHDGEAFERIKDFLDQQKQKSDREGQTQNSDENISNDSSHSGGEQSDNQNSDNNSTASEQNSASENEVNSDSNSDNQNTTDSGSENAKGNDPSQSGGPQNKNSDSTDATNNTADNEQPQVGDDQTGQPNPPGNQTDNQTSEGAQGETSDTETSSNQSSVDESSTEQSNSGDSDAGGQNSEASTSSSPRDLSDEPNNQRTDQDQKPPESDQESSSGANSESRTGQPNTAASDGEEVFGDGTLDNPQPPDEVNLDYAKQATDLVLDYLESTRDNPNPDLLENLNWTEEELADFVQRWRQIRELPTTNGESGTRELEESLRSLGIKAPNSISSRIGETTDSLGGIKDSGNSIPVPAAYRDAFNAFRRAMSQSE